jgi:hypothetical protein
MAFPFHKKNFYKKKITKNGSISDPKIFSNHTGQNAIDSKILFPHLDNFVQSAFIDPGKTSCAIRIVRYWVNINIIEPLWFGIHNFGLDIENIILGMETELEPIKEKLKLCHHIIIEHQIMKSSTNFRTFQHMISHIESFTRNVGMRPVIFEVDIALKTVFLGGPRTAKENGGVDIKEWTKKRSRDTLLKRKDYISLAILENCCVKQNEDLSDTVGYDEAWHYYIKNLDHLCWKK